MDFNDLMNKNSEPITLYIAYRAFGGLRKFSANYKHRKPESLSLSIALLAIY